MLVEELPGALAERRSTLLNRLVEVVIPVYNEEHVLEASVSRLHEFLLETFPFRFRITIADNASIDSTWEVAQRLEAELPYVQAVHLDQKGRGRALRYVAQLPAGMGRQLPAFAVIGVLSTLAYLALYAALRPVSGAQVANFLALLITAVANTAANRRFTFRVRGSADAVRHQLQGGVVFLVSLALSSGSLWILHATDPKGTHLVELSALVLANAVSTLVRFLLLRVWVFGRKGAVAQA